MRQVGRLTQWKDEEGYGFITPKGGGDSIFVHIKSFSNRQQRPHRNDIVSYHVVFDEKDRAQAESVVYVVDVEPAPDFSLKGPGSLAFAVFFALFITVWAWEGRLPLSIPGFYLVASTFAFLAYRKDKSKARNNQWRIPEDSLHLWSLIGGWPGAALAQKLYHHKSKKRSFQIVYWFTIVLNSVGFFWLLSPQGSAQLHSLLSSLGLR
jgi:uncharacterized membrane protein YsdA (DUF1294 family)/cold shock CspA family protein